MEKIDPLALRYQNITVSGILCTGTSTLSSSLRQKLSWKHRDAGTLTREYVKEKNIDLSLATKRPDNFDREVDAYCVENLRRKTGLILEGWLSGFMAQGIDGVLKALLVCSNDGVRVDRLANRDNKTIEEAKKEIRIREVENVKKWSKLYGTSDFWNPINYDLVIDTFSCSKEETLKKVLEKLGYQEKRK